ncbi:transmembrane protein 186 isoform X1 [Lampetra fluviatilis]
MQANFTMDAKDPVTFEKKAGFVCRHHGSKLANYTRKLPHWVKARSINIAHSCETADCNHLRSVATSFVIASRYKNGANIECAPDLICRSTSGEDGRGDVFIPIYRFPAIRATRFISRLKNVQTIFMVVALPPIYYLHTQGLVDEHSLRLTSGVAVLACCSLYGISHYLRRWVGLMALSADGNTLRVSHLSFWGGRRDRLVPVADVVPLSEGRDRPQDPLLALRCYSHRDVLYFSLRYGRVLDGAKFRAVFGDTFVSPDR